MSVTDPPLFVLWYEFTKWLLNRTAKFPKNIRFTFSQRIDNLALDIVQDLAAARYALRKSELLTTVNLKLDQMRVLLRLCHDLAHLDHKAYQHAARQIDEAGRMLGGWRKQRADKEMG